MLWILVTSSASARPIAGRIDGIRRASIVFPVPGAPSSSRLWPPAAAISSASNGAAWPLMSARSGSAGGAGRPPPSGNGGTEPPASTSAAARSSETPATSSPSTSAASRARSRGTTNRLSPARRAPRRPPAPRASRGAAAQRQLAEHRIAGERLDRDLPARGEHSERERRVEARDRPCAETRGEIRGDPGLRELESRVRDRRPDPVPRLPHRRVREPDDRERGQAAADVDLDPDLAGIDPVDRECGEACEHPANVRTVGSGWCTRRSNSAEATRPPLTQSWNTA